MNIPLVTRGKNITYLQDSLLKTMDGVDLTQVVDQAQELVKHFPDVGAAAPNRQGLILGHVQSGKTNALTTAIAMAADNGYRCFIVLTTDNLWLYGQTIERLKTDLQGLSVEGKDDWERGLMFMPTSLSDADGLVLVATKNGQVLTKLLDLLDRLRPQVDGELPPAVIIDDEADQASLDTQKRRRAKNPNLDPGKISDLIVRLRGQFPRHTFVQVTATPQALFLQEEQDLFRPEFTVLIEPGKGYVGGETFFSLIDGRGAQLIRYVDQQELDIMLTRPRDFDRDIQAIPASLRAAVCTFYVGATIKYLQNQDSNKPMVDLVYSFLCHISQRKTHHDIAYAAIAAYYQHLRVGLSTLAAPDHRRAVEQALQDAYDDLIQTITGPVPTFIEVVEELQKFAVSTEIQVLNSDKEQDQPHYSRRYNILIGGTKLARGVTIKNLLVTYYGRQAKTTNMDTMLQHARMFGYREKDLDVTRLFVTPDVEERFRAINDSEKALRDLVQRFPNEIYRGIRISRGLRATRPNVLDPNNVGAYAAGSSSFPRKPLYRRADVEQRTMRIDIEMDQLYPIGRRDSVEITIDRMIELIELTGPAGGGLWDTDRIKTALATIKDEYGNKGYLIARRDRALNPGANGQLNSYFGGGRQGGRGESALANPNYPTLFMFRLVGKSSGELGKPGWDNTPFWVPNVQFPDGQYALMFNFE